MAKNVNPGDDMAKKFATAESGNERDSFTMVTDRNIAAPTWCSMPLLVTEFESSTTSNTQYASRVRKASSFDFIVADRSDRYRKQNIKSSNKQHNNGARKPIWNLLVLSIGWMLFFMSFTSIRNIQSSINHEDGLGLYSLAGVYGGYMVACCFTTVIVKRLSPKWTLVVGMVGQIIYVLTIMYPKSYIILPISVIGGFMQCAMWTAQATLIMEVSIRAPNTQMKCTGAVVSKYFGVFYGFTSFSPVIGSVTLALLISIAQNENVEGNLASELRNVTSDITYSNSSMSANINKSSAAFRSFQINPSSFTFPDQFMSGKPEKFNLDKDSNISRNKGDAQNLSFNTEYQLANCSSVTAKPVNTLPKRSVVCGTKFCHNDVSDEEKALLDISMYTRNVLSLTLAACMVIPLAGFAVLLEGWRSFSRPEGCAFKQFMSMFKLLKTKQFLYISPLIFYHGIQTAFFSGEVTKAFVGCVFGIEIVGSVTACFGACAAVSAFISGRLERPNGKLPLFIAGGALNLITLLAMRLWTPSSSDMMFIFFASGFWGLAEGIWTTHINSIVGLLFHQKTEAAFSCFNLLVAFGLTVSYASANYVCMAVKMYAVACFCVIGVSSFAVLSRHEVFKNQNL